MEMYLLLLPQGMYLLPDMEFSENHFAKGIDKGIFSNNMCVW